MSDPTSDTTTGDRGEQPLHAAPRATRDSRPYRAARPVSEAASPREVASATAMEDSVAPPYTAPYPPFPYDPPQQAAVSETVASGLAYMTVVPAILFLLIEPYRRSATLRFHSWQSIFYFVVFAGLRVVELLLAATLPSAIAFLIGNLLLLVFFAGWLVAVIRAFQGGRFMLPVVGSYAERIAEAGSNAR